jgi:hypothetical protein
LIFPPTAFSPPAAAACWAKAGTTKRAAMIPKTAPFIHKLFMLSLLSPLSLASGVPKPEFSYLLFIQ